MAGAARSAAAVAGGVAGATVTGGAVGCAVAGVIGATTGTGVGVSVGVVAVSELLAEARNVIGFAVRSTAPTSMTTRLPANAVSHAARCESASSFCGGA